MESLLSLTSRRAGEWFKEELRSLGALDHIVDTGTYIIVLLWRMGIAYVHIKAILSVKV